MVEKEKHVGSNPGKQEDKAPYRAPRLMIYGDIRQMTLTAQRAMSADNPGMDMNMTG